MLVAVTIRIIVNISQYLKFFFFWFVCCCCCIVSIVIYIIEVFSQILGSVSLVGCFMQFYLYYFDTVGYAFTYPLAQMFCLQSYLL